ncbi:MAG: twitching motility protein PilT [Tissierellia bacterium]|nr:twitching motility protein PilT [Tissierellia bacterium]
MVKFIVGEMGSGKTKIMIDMANEAVKKSKGHIVYIDRDNSHVYDLDRSLRFINTGEFRIENLKTFYGFLCGVISQNFDIEKVFIDGLKVISQAENSCIKDFISDMEDLHKEFGVNFIVSLSRNIDEVPEFLKPYL